MLTLQWDYLYNKKIRTDIIDTTCWRLQEYVDREDQFVGPVS